MWDMVIGTGVYTNRCIDAGFGAYLRLIGLVVVGALVVGGALAFVLARDITADAADAGAAGTARRRRPMQARWS